MTLKLAQFCDDPKKISTKSSYSKKIFIFLKTQKNIEIQNFEPIKMGRAYVCVKISVYPLGFKTPKNEKKIIRCIQNRRYTSSMYEQSCKFEYKGMKTVGVTDYTNKTPLRI